MQDAESSQFATAENRPIPLASETGPETGPEIEPATGAASDGGRPPRVLQIIDNLALGGAQRLLIILAQHLGPQQPLQVYSVTAGDTLMRNTLRAAGAELRETAGVRLWNPLSWRRVARAIRDSGAEVVHVHLTYATILAAPLARLQRRRVVVSLHNADTARSSGGSSGLRRRVLHWLEDISLRHFTDQVIFVGENVARANRGRIGRTPGVTVRNVIAPPVAPAAPQRHDLRVALGAADTDLVLIATGRLTAQKNPEGLLRAFARLVPLVPHARLWLVGDGPLGEYVAHLRRELGLEAHVALPGERGDVAALLAAADIFVLPSAWEGLPLGLLEAMAQGLPVVATRVGDVGHVLTEGAGLLVPPMTAADDTGTEAFVAALAALAADPAQRAALAEGARRAAHPYTDVAGWYRQLTNLYRGAAPGQGGHP